MKKITTQQLWQLDPKGFNRWRRENDLPELLDYFRTSLPDFQKWQSMFEISNTDFLSAPGTGTWFLGDSPLEFVEYTYDDEQRFTIVTNFENAFSFSSKHHAIVKIRSITFEPYLLWGRKRSRKTKFILTDKANNSYSDTIGYGTWTEILGLSRALLLREHEVLKLGQVEISGGVDVSQRNLDFTDLDGVVFKGDWHGSHAAEVKFSSCRRMVFKGCSMHHYTFVRCVTNDLYACEARLQDFVFRDCDLTNPRFDSCIINGLSITETRFSIPIFDRCEVSRFVYKPTKEFLNPNIEADNYRRIRALFQNIGKRKEAEAAYYQERCFERKSLWSPYFHYRSMFPKFGSMERYLDIWRTYREGRINGSETITHIFRSTQFKLGVWLIPKYFISAISFKLQYIWSMLECMIWGYGLRPGRIVGFAGIAVATFAVIFFLHGPTQGNWVNSVYFSSVTFTTLGYGDIQPTRDVIKLVCSIEALTGAVSMGLLIGSLANRSRY